jgi:hypothetical protein
LKGWSKRLRNRIQTDTNPAAAKNLDAAAKGIPCFSLHLPAIGLLQFPVNVLVPGVVALRFIPRHNPAIHYREESGRASKCVL